MAAHNISGNFCFKCRDMMQKRDDIVPCDRDGICWITKKAPEDEDAPMVSDFKTQFIIDLWERITAASGLERLERKKDEKTNVVYYLPSLEKMEMILSLTDWKTAPICKFSTVELVVFFHNEYRKYKTSS